MKQNRLPHKSFTEQEIQGMKQRMKNEKDSVLHRKYQAIYLHMTGKTNIEIAEIISRCKQTVGTYLHTYFDKGLDALVPVKQTGRPKWLTKEQLATLKQVITAQTPHEAGFDHAYNWTAKLVILWVEKEFGVRYANSSMQQIMHQEKLSYTRPTYHLEKASTEKQHAFAEELDGVKKTDFP